MTDTDQTARRLRLLTATLQARLREAARDSPSSDLGLQQQAMLYRLSLTGPSSIKDLAVAERLRHQSAAELVAALRKKQLVHTEPDPQDRRKSIVTITPSARSLIEENFAHREQWLRTALEAALTDSETEKLVEALPLLERVASWEPPASAHR
ncbi:MarR family transcriptional regulator [Gordonia sp. ABSL11-1]|uniref:MarR family winged helix-turn-helix transcriptional regulator n=1 Tax=Gordonia sp. ABSL11-1 TaxID=3053924 RepID=UPI0025742746|nr:MarR family transcriptional regulator [Gordonia sp. ABSL11-1]MDL9945315.1 MarR family transcriptional regulator [Gordonia sp. ABSL11-1]